MTTYIACLVLKWQNYDLSKTPDI